MSLKFEVKQHRYNELKSSQINKETSELNLLQNSVNMLHNKEIKYFLEIRNTIIID